MTEIATKKRGRPPKTKPVETDEQKRERLISELQALGAGTVPTIPLPDSSAPLGQNYWHWPHNKLKTELVSRGIIERSGDRTSMVQALQAEDARKGFRPFPLEAQDEEPGLRSSNSPVSAIPQNRDSIRIVDKDGCQYAMVYRIGRWVGGQPVLLDMEKNAELIVAALNGGKR